MNITAQIIALWNIFYDHADVRIRDKFLMGSPYAIGTIYFCYFVFFGGIFPIIMKNRKPVDYVKSMTIVDVILCIRASYFLINGIYLWFFEYNWRCQPIDLSNSWLSQFELRICYEFVISKFVYILQSYVFVSSKKNSTVGIYLLIHHSLFPMMLWMLANYYPGGHIMFILFINSFVHFIVTGMRIINVAFPACLPKNIVKSVDVYMHVSFNYIF